MIDPVIIDYINRFIIKKSEQLDPDRNTMPDSPFVDVKIIRRTERTFRVAGILTLSPNGCDPLEGAPDEEMRKLSLSPRKRVTLDDHNPLTLQWLENGWIIKEIRFQKDEKTVDSMQYRMGFRYYKYEAEQMQNKQNAMLQMFQGWKENAASLESSFEPEVTKYKRNLLRISSNIREMKAQGLQGLHVSPLFPEKWSITKRLKFLHFAVAFIQVCHEKAVFDWKEIGAHYYKGIGGSKAFDLEKDDFIAQLEEWAQCPAVSLGLTSLGTITPLFFSGQMTGRYSAYQFGPVHALTDLSIWDEAYTTEVETLWLVENRGVLTRIAAENGFLMKTNSLVICVDGHLRTSHRTCIQQLLQNGSIVQVIIWSDYDPDGVKIAKELYEAVSQCGKFAIKWVTHELEVMESWQHYEEYMKTLLQHRSVEQEQVLGGVEDWKKWIAR